MLKDLRHAARMLRHVKGWTAVVVLSLGLGIGANAALFSVVDAALLRPLPYLDPDSLILVFATNESRGIPRMGSAPPDFREWRDRNHSFERMTAFYGGRFNLSAPSEEPERVSGLYVTADFFAVLGVQAAKGRTFLPEEETYGRHRAAVVSHGLWQRRLGSNPAAIGRTITLNEETYTIVGIMPEEYRDPASGITSSWGRTQAELWVPMAFEPESNWNTRNNYFLLALGRLKPGVSLAQARADIGGISARIRKEFKESEGIGSLAITLQQTVRGDYSLALAVLSGAVGLVLLIACGNVAALLLARASARRKELAIRAALGATRARLVRQLLAESLLLSLAGGSLGLLLALWGADALAALGPPRLNQFHKVAIDLWALAYLFGLSLLTAVVFGLAPALLGSRAGLAEPLKEGAGRGAASGTGGGRARGMLVVGEIALSLVLLVGAGLLIRSFVGLVRVDPGFRSMNLLTLQLALPKSKYPDAPKAGQFFEQVLARVRTAPGVLAAGVTSSLPLSGQGGWGKQLTIEERPALRLDQVPSVQYRLVSADFFRAMGTPLRSGRLFTDADRKDALPVAIVSETLARRLYPGENPLGHRISMNAPDPLIPPEGRPPNFRIVWLTVVGVVSDVKQVRLSEPAAAEVYAPHLQNLEEPVPMFVAVRTESDPMLLASYVRAAVREVDPNQPIARIATMGQVIRGSMAQPRFNTFLLGIFAAIALVLALVGIYGMMSYSVAQRAHEIGIRMAIGARREDVLRMILGQALRLMLAGMAIGLGGALAVSRAISGLLFGVAPADPSTFIAVPMLFALVAHAASYVPARRATKVDPMVVLRNE